MIPTCIISLKMVEEGRYTHLRRATSHRIRHFQPKPVVGMIVARSISGFVPSARSALLFHRGVNHYRIAEYAAGPVFRSRSLFLQPSRSLCVDGCLNRLCVFSTRNRITSLSLRPSAPSPASCRPHSARPDQAFAPRLESDRAERRRMTGICVRREKAALSSGCKSHPANAPAGSNRSGIVTLPWGRAQSVGG